MKFRSIAIISAFSIFAAGCGNSSEKETTSKKEKATSSDTTSTVKQPVNTDKTPAKTVVKPRVITRGEFNLAALQLNAPLYWIDDTNNNQKPDPSEITSLLFYDSIPVWVKDGAFTPEFEKISKSIRELVINGYKGSDKSEMERIKLVLEDLAQGRPTVVFNDLSKLSEEDKNIIRGIHKVSVMMDNLYKAQLGISELKPSDAPSKRMMERNWGPSCKSPRQENNPKCSALKNSGKQIYGIYPASLQKEKDFCKKLEAADKKIRRKESKLLYQFNVVEEKKGKLVAVPYHKHFEKLMKPIAKELKAISGIIKNPKEKALKKYLLEAAKGFETNKWENADKAWAAMNATNSRYYVRIAPDEVYWDPCNSKAGFHVTFSLINPQSLNWQKKLLPIKNDMEKVLAKHIGKPYKARKVKVHLPDFIDIITNAGNDRSPFGGTIGQSLPNWGAVAKSGGRTVVMSNLYTDKDSMEIRKQKAISLFDTEIMKNYPETADPGLLSIILHEVTHNLGPVHEYVYKGKKDAQWFGGALSTTLEELKAQTGALWYVDFLLKKKIITKKFAEETYVDSIFWAINHISRGMYSDGKKPKPYSQLAAIHVGFLMDEKAIEFLPEKTAANGKDKGVFVFHLDKFPAAVDKLMKIVGHIKASGDRKKAEELIAKYVDGKVVPMDIIKERILKYSKATFVYGYKLQ
ncbi:MAG: hypothetical protein JXR95_02775 [Deltaproteobacteria bacterium]|nr:hypothetical protein [Deltaproteobacteria bacterium]